MCKTLGTNFIQALLILTAIAVFPLRTSLAEDENGRPLLSMRFSGSNNDPGWLFKLDTTGGYRFNRHFEITAGLPFYFVRVSEDGIGSGYSSKAGIGNFYVDLRVMAEISRYYFSSSLRGAAPTGNEEEGFSSGRVTLDWNNYLEYDAGKWIPFGSAGIANSISDTHFFTRPFTSLGIVGQFEGGLLYHPDWWIGLGGSGYAVMPTGEQKIYSRLNEYRMIQSDPVDSYISDGVRRRRKAIEEFYYTVGAADLARDHGISSWVDIYALPGAVFEFGYSRSIALEYNTLSFSIRFDLAGMMSRETF